MRLRSALEQALGFIEEAASGAYERIEAEALLPVLRETLAGDGEDSPEQAGEP